MKATLKLRRLSFSMILVLSVLVSVLLGTGIAYADTVVKSLTSGTHYYYMNHSTFSGPEYDYFQRDEISRSSDSTEVTVIKSYYYSGTADNDVWFGDLYVYDEVPNMVHYTDFRGTFVNNCNAQKDLGWNNDEMDEDNNHVGLEQFVLQGFGEAMTEAETAFTVYWTGIGTY